MTQRYILLFVKCEYNFSDSAGFTLRPPTRKTIQTIHQLAGRIRDKRHGKSNKFVPAKNHVTVRKTNYKLKKSPKSQVTPMTAVDNSQRRLPKKADSQNRSPKVI